jgi:hypothetical protein
MSGATVEGEARRALNRLRRALEKSEKELDSVVGALRHAEGEDFPSGGYEGAREAIRSAMDFVDGEGERLQEKILRAGGLEPGRVRRSSSPG